MSPLILVHGTHQKGSTFWNAITKKNMISFLPEVNKEEEVELVNLPERNCDSLEQCDTTKPSKRSCTSGMGITRRPKHP
jgi:hypothetical protein